jgi:sulfur-oxidizing protein SoxY
MSKLNRRNLLAISGGVATSLLIPVGAFASKGDEAITAFTNGQGVRKSGITLTSPEIAENGNTVPISVEAPGAVSIIILAMKNPTPDVAKFNFGPLAANQKASTRIRLRGTQDVVAVAKLADGSFVQDTKVIKVTIGGCGG